MAAAVITSYNVKELTGNISEEMVDVYITTTGDWFLSKFSEILNVQASGIGAAAFVAAIAGNKITLTATATTRVHLRIIGRP